MGPDAMTGALLRGALDTDTGEAMLPCAYRTREVGPPGTAAGQSHDPPWQLQREHRPAAHSWSSASWSPQLTEKKFLLFYVLQFGLMCCDSHRKWIQCIISYQVTI